MKEVQWREKESNVLGRFKIWRKNRDEKLNE